MIKKTITFKDLDGNPLTEDFYFAVNTAEITELVVVDPIIGGYVERMAADENTPVIGAEVMHIFKTFIAVSVGKRSEDGRRFIKNDEIRDDFMQTDAFPVLFMELCTKPDEAANFVNGIMPGDLNEIIAKLPAETVATEEPAWIKENRVPTETELVGATPDQLREAFRRKSAAN